jgi:hypothetical protein
MGDLKVWSTLRRHPNLNLNPLLENEGQTRYAERLQKAIVTLKGVNANGI